MVTRSPLYLQLQEERFHSFKINLTASSADFEIEEEG
jgi:hypothetical protein